MHWCQDETLAAMSAVPVVGVLFRKAHKWYHNKTHHKCHHEGCHDEHAEHMTVDGEILAPNLPDREALAPGEVDAKFGNLATILLMFDRRMLKSYTFPDTSEFEWFLAPEDKLEARWKNKFFSWNGAEWHPIPDVIPPTKEELLDRAVELLRITLEERGSEASLSQVGKFLESL